MRRGFLLALTIFLCAALCACGAEEAAPTAPAETIASPVITDHPLLEKAYGQWILRNADEVNEHFYREMTIREDGTCLVDGQEFTWRIDEGSQDNQLRLSFWLGSEPMGGAIYYGDFDNIADLAPNGCIHPSAFINTARASALEMEKADPETYRVPQVTGQWIPTESAEGVPGSIMLREDRTCTVDGAEYTWDFSYTNGDAFGIDVFAGETVKYELSLPLYNNLERVIIVYTENDRCVYINPDHYDIIEITPENWLDYFEITSWVSWEEDAFGTVEALSGCYYCISLKEEYVYFLSSAVTGGDILTKNAMEIGFSYGFQECQVQLQEKICTPIEGTYVFKDTETYTNNLRYYLNPRKYEMLIGGYPMSVSEDKIPVLTDLELLRVNCPLYLLKEEYRVEN